MRASSAGSAASGAASLALRARARREREQAAAPAAGRGDEPLHLGVELPQQRHDLVRQHLGRERADLLDSGSRRCLSMTKVSGTP